MSVRRPWYLKKYCSCVICPIAFPYFQTDWTGKVWYNLVQIHCQVRMWDRIFNDFQNQIWDKYQTNIKKTISKKEKIARQVFGAIYPYFLWSKFWSENNMHISTDLPLYLWIFSFEAWFLFDASFSFDIVQIMIETWKEKLALIFDQATNAKR